MQETRVRFQDWDDPLEKEMATHRLLPRMRFTPKEIPIPKTGQNHLGPSENPNMVSVSDHRSAWAISCVSLSPKP